ncbi:hypothetical protein IWX90DRAFT_490802 [Phyllosticta citrichinensis]|uniref:DUF221-domain-containing protein n=1 Tax=Phyllosticta citrichinensis TaxID=1130410 RepID=A0ABR1XF97_9PEZI
MSLAASFKQPWDGGAGTAWKRADVNISDAWSSAAGTAQEDEGMSLAQLTASCAVGLVALGFCLFVFTILRTNISRIYEPASTLVPERQRMEPPKRGLFTWIKPVIETRRHVFIERAGLDAYCFVRFFFMQLKLFLPLACVVTPIVVSLNSVGVADKSEGGLDRFAWGNLDAKHTNRYSGHLVMAIVVIVWFCYVIHNELIYYVEVRQKWMTSPSHRIRASATTVLVENIPDKWCHVKALDELFDVFPGGIRNIWVNRDFGDLLDKKRKQLELTRRLENAETELVRACHAKAWAIRKKALEDPKLKQVTSKERKAMARKDEMELNELAVEMMNRAGHSTGNPQNPTNFVDQLKAKREMQEKLNLSDSAAKKLIGTGRAAANWGIGAVREVGHGVGKTIGGVAGYANRLKGPRPVDLKDDPTHQIPEEHLLPQTHDGANDYDGEPRIDPDHIHHDHQHAQSNFRASRAATAIESDLEHATLNLAASSDRLHHGPDAAHGHQTAIQSESNETEPDVRHALTHRHSDYLHKSGTPPVHDDPSAENVRQQRWSNQQHHLYDTTRGHTSPVPGSGVPRPAALNLPKYTQRNTIAELEQNEHNHDVHHLNPRRLFRKHSSFPSPEPSHLQDDEYPITRASPQPDCSPSSATTSDMRHTHRAEAAPTTEAVQNVDDLAEKQEISKKTKDKYAKMPKIINWEVYDAKLEEECENAAWTKYIRRKDRETMRISLFPRSIIWWKIWPSWWPSFGKKVDVILYCRMQLLELNKEIAADEAHLDKFPLMNSAFIQFNHQAAAHMACQSITHHKPKNMGPRIIEMDPKNVIWDNLSITWWNKYIRTASVIAIILGIIITWAIPMAFVGLLSQLDTISTRLTWLHWVANLPRWLKSVIQGVLPPTLQALLLLLLPDIFRLLVEFTGVPTRMQVELDLQAYWFIFLFVQVFLVVTLSSGLTNVIQQIANSPLSVPQILAQNLPKGSNYFYSYMILQALTSSSMSLSQIAALFQWFILRKILDSTARQKFERAKRLPAISWGVAFALHTNFTVIVLVYSIIAPLMLVFGCIVSSLYLLVQRYNCLFVNRWRTDSGGLFFPRAVNQTFTGIYVMVLVLIGLFFLVRDEQGDVVCIPHAIVMIVVGVGVIIYQYMLNKSLGPLFTYVPITMEDDAQARQDEYEQMLETRFMNALNPQRSAEDVAAMQPGSTSPSHMLPDPYSSEPLVRLGEQPPVPGSQYTATQADGQQEERSPSTEMPPPRQSSRSQGPGEMQQDSRLPASPNESATVGDPHYNTPSCGGDGATQPQNASFDGHAESHIKSPETYMSSSEDSGNSDSSRHAHAERLTQRLAALPEGPRAPLDVSKTSPTTTGSSDSGPALQKSKAKGGAEEKDIELSEYKKLNRAQMARNLARHGGQPAPESEGTDPEAKSSSKGGFLFEGYHDELEDLTPAERDLLVQRAFHHEALRMMKPAVWIPQDIAKVAEDEVRRSEALCNELGIPRDQNLWVTTEYSSVDAKAKVNFTRPPPDFNSAEEFMQL